MADPEIHVSFNCDDCFDKRHLLYQLTDHPNVQSYIYNLFTRGSEEFNQIRESLEDKAGNNNQNWISYFEKYDYLQYANGEQNYGYKNIAIEQIYDLDFTPCSIVALFNDATVVFELPEVILPTQILFVTNIGMYRLADEPIKQDHENSPIMTLETLFEKQPSVNREFGFAFKKVVYSCNKFVTVNVVQIPICIPYKTFITKNDKHVILQQMSTTHHQYINQRFKEVNELLPKSQLTPIIDLQYPKQIMNGSSQFVATGSNALLFMNHTHRDTDYFKYDYFDSIIAEPANPTDPVPIPDQSYQTFPCIHIVPESGGELLNIKPNPLIPFDFDNTNAVLQAKNLGTHLNKFTLLLAIIKCLDEQIPMYIYNKEQLWIVMEIMWLLYRGYYTVLQKHIKTITDDMKKVINAIRIPNGSTLEQELQTKCIPISSIFNDAYQQLVCDLDMAQLHDQILDITSRYILSTEFLPRLFVVIDPAFEGTAFYTYQYHYGFATIYTVMISKSAPTIDQNTIDNINGTNRGQIDPIDIPIGNFGFYHHKESEYTEQDEYSLLQSMFLYRIVDKLSDPIQPGHNNFMGYDSVYNQALILNYNMIYAFLQLKARTLAANQQDVMVQRDRYKSIHTEQRNVTQVAVNSLIMKTPNAQIDHIQEQIASILETQIGKDNPTLYEDSIVLQYQQCVRLQKMFTAVLAIKLLRLDPLIKESPFREYYHIIADLVYIKDKIISMYRELNKYPFNFGLLDRVCKFESPEKQIRDPRFNFIVDLPFCGTYCVAIDLDSYDIDLARQQLAGVGKPLLFISRGKPQFYTADIRLIKTYIPEEFNKQVVIDTLSTTQDALDQQIDDIPKVDGVHPPLTIYQPLNVSFVDIQKLQEECSISNYIYNNIDQHTIQTLTRIVHLVETHIRNRLNYGKKYRLYASLLKKLINTPHIHQQLQDCINNNAIPTHQINNGRILASHEFEISNAVQKAGDRSICQITYQKDAISRREQLELNLKDFRNAIETVKQYVLEHRVATFCANISNTGDLQNVQVIPQEGQISSDGRSFGQITTVDLSGSSLHIRQDREFFLKHCCYTRAIEICKDKNYFLNFGHLSLLLNASKTDYITQQLVYSYLRLQLALKNRDISTVYQMNEYAKEFKTMLKDGSDVLQYDSNQFIYEVNEVESYFQIQAPFDEYQYRVYLMNIFQNALVQVKDFVNKYSDDAIEFNKKLSVVLTDRVMRGESKLSTQAQYTHFIDPGLQLLAFQLIMIFKSDAFDMLSHICHRATTDNPQLAIIPILIQTFLSGSTRTDVLGKQINNIISVIQGKNIPIPDKIQRVLRKQQIPINPFLEFLNRKTIGYQPLGSTLYTRQIGNDGDIPAKDDGNPGDIGWGVHTAQAEEKQRRVLNFLYSSFDSIGSSLKYFGGNQIINPTTQLNENATQVFYFKRNSARSQKVDIQPIYVENTYQNDIYTQSTAVQNEFELYGGAFMYECGQDGLPINRILPDAPDKAYSEQHLSILYLDTATLEDAKSTYVDSDLKNPLIDPRTGNPQQILENDRIYRVIHTGRCSDPDHVIMYAEAVKSKLTLELDFNYVIFRRATKIIKQQLPANPITLALTDNAVSQFHILDDKKKYDIDPSFTGTVYVYNRDQSKEYTKDGVRYVFRQYPKLMGTKRMSGDYKKVLYAIQSSDYDAQSIVVLESPNSQFKSMEQLLQDIKYLQQPAGALQIESDGIDMFDWYRNKKGLRKLSPVTMYYLPFN